MRHVQALNGSPINYGNYSAQQLGEVPAHTKTYICIYTDYHSHTKKTERKRTTHSDILILRRARRYARSQRPTARRSTRMTMTTEAGQ